MEGGGGRWSAGRLGAANCLAPLQPPPSSAALPLARAALLRSTCFIALQMQFTIQLCMQIHKVA
jgi:hypothetical protein